MAEEQVVSTDLIDISLEVPYEPPEGEESPFPKELHILFNRTVVEFAEQYRDALMVSRSLPFNVDLVGTTDPLTLLIANTMGAKKTLKAEEASRRAQQTYSKWIDAAEKEAWTLAILYDNTFNNQPTAYPPPKPPAPGIGAIPEPQRSLVDPVEYRLKQILDTLNISIEFRQMAEKAINDTLTKMAQYGEAVKEKDSFRVQPTTVDPSIYGIDVADGGGKSTRSKRRVQNS